MSDTGIEHILEFGFLGAIAREDLLSLKPPPTTRALKTGDTLLWEGETGHTYYLLLRGRLRRFVETEFGERTFVGDVMPGQGVGASGLLSDGGNSATVRAIHDSEVVCFSRATFLQMMVISWEFAMGVSREQVEWVRAAAAPRRRHPTIKTIAAVFLDPKVDQQAFISALAGGLGTMTTVATADHDDVEASLPEGLSKVGDQQESENAYWDGIVNRLEGLERGHEVVLYPIASTPDKWSRLIFDRSDLILLVTGVDGPADLCEIETELIEPIEHELLPRIDLAVVHGEDWASDCRTARWLDGRHVDEWHHLRSGRGDDFKRLARILTGNAITLVLGGGGARGMAEIGVYRAFVEADIPIDRVAGTSMGSLIGGLIASGKDPDTITRDVRFWAETGKPGKDYTLPLLSFVHGKKGHHVTREVLGDTQIEDLPLSYFCVSADLSENRAVVHDRGSLWRASRASMSLPGIGPPLFEDGRILVDGGTLNNVPADIAAERYSGQIVLVDVQMPRKRLVSPSYNNLVPSGWQILWHRINPLLKPLKLPGIYEILARSSTLASQVNYRKARQLADLAIYPPVSGVALLDFEALDRLVDIGHEHTVAQLSSIGKERLEEMFKAMKDVKLPAASGKVPPIDRAQFNEILGVDDDETFRDMVGMFIEMFPAELDQLAAALPADGCDRIRESAHRAKSAAANLAAPRLRALLQDIENRAKNGDMEGLSDCVDLARVEFNRIKTYFNGQAEAST